MNTHPFRKNGAPQILVVDDSAASLKLLTDILTDYGCRVRPASDGHLALRSVAAEAPDLILLDVRMPGLDGFEICRRLKSDEKSRSIPVIFISALDEITDKVEGFEAGGVDYITKPFKAGEVLARVGTHLRLRELTESLEQKVRERTEELTTINQQLRTEIIERERTEERLRKLNRAFRALNDSNQALIRATDEVSLLDEVCRIVVEHCGYPLAWIGFAELDYARTVRPVARAGIKDRYLDTANITWADTEHGRGPTGTAIRSGKPVVNQDTTENPDYGPWRGEALKRGYASSAAFPLVLAGSRTLGALNVYAHQPNAFSAEEIDLLSELAQDLAYGIVSLRGRSHRAQMEEELLTISRQWQITFDAVSDVVWLLDRDFRIVNSNKACVDLLGKRSGEVIGQHTWTVVFGTQEPPSQCPLLRMQETRSRAYSEFRVDDRWLNVTADPILDDAGIIQGAVYILHDVSELKRAEEEREKLEVHLRQSQKLEAIGTLAGGIAHDFNNILSPIIAYAELALYGKTPKHRLRHDFSQILQAGNRARELVKQILTFSRQSEKIIQPVRISPIIKETLKLLRASLPSTIAIREAVSEEAASSMALADPTQIHQILMNLCTNSAHAMRDNGGVLEVSLDKTDLESEEAALTPDLGPGPYLRLVVADTGHGMTEAVKERIFDPYFTTKDKTEGTGLGLFVAYGIVKNHGGAMSVDSTPGKGTRVQILLPRLEEKAENPVESNKPIPKGTGRILLVDDESTIIRSQVRLLHHLGYRVTARLDSVEALNAFRTEPDRFDLVISDYTMPRMTGADLAREILRLRPHMPIILCTGFSERLTEEQAAALGVRALIMKPFDIHDLAAKIRFVLDEASKSR